MINSGSMHIVGSNPCMMVLGKKLDICAVVLEGLGGIWCERCRLVIFR